MQISSDTTRRTVSTVRLRSRSRLLFAKVVLVIVGVIAGLLVAEAGLRLYGFNYFNPYIVDQDLGHSLRPNAEGWWNREGLTYVKINSQGFRDREHSVAKPPDTFRIAILGDSFAEAFQVPSEKTFWSVIEAKLQQCPQTAKKKVEVLNFGVSGFSTARELILLRNRVWQYSPDLVILLVTIANDIRDNSPRLNAYSGQPLPYFIFRDGNLVLDDSRVAARNRTLIFRLQKSFVGNLYHWLQAHVRILGLIYAVREGNQSTRLSKGDKPDSSDPGGGNEPGLDQEVYRPSATPEWEEAWRITEALILKMRDEVQVRGAKFLVVTGSSGIQVSPDATARKAFMNSLGISTLFYPDERIKSLGQAAGFDVLNLAPSLYEYASANGVFVHGTAETGGRGHWNQTGHRLAGEIIANEICRANQVSGGF